jgi:hypothetical protein
LGRVFDARGGAHNFGGRFRDGLVEHGRGDGQSEDGDGREVLAAAEAVIAGGRIAFGGAGVGGLAGVGTGGCEEQQQDGNQSRREAMRHG